MKKCDTYYSLSSVQPYMGTIQQCGNAKVLVEVLQFSILLDISTLFFTVISTFFSFIPIIVERFFDHPAGNEKPPSVSSVGSSILTL